MDDNKKIKVVNRAGNGVVGYSIPEIGVTRTFQDGEKKYLTYEEIRKLSYIPGGEAIIKEYLIIDDKESLEQLNFNPELEYFYTKEDIIKVMTQGSLDEFLDCLDFAPEGVLETIKTVAVDLPLNDVAKRKAILQKLHFDVDNAIRIKEMSEEDNNEPIVKPVGERRAAGPSKEDKTGPKTERTGRRVIIKE